MEEKKTLSLWEKVQKVNELLVKDEPKNVSHDSYSGFTGYEPQYIMDAMNEVFGLDGWGFKDVSNEVGKVEVIAKVRVWLLAGIDENKRKIRVYRSAYGGKKNQLKKGSETDWNMTWGDCRKSAQTDALKKALSYFSIGNKPFKGDLPAPAGAKKPPYQGNSSYAKKPAQTGSGYQNKYAKPYTRKPMSQAPWEKKTE